MNIGIAAIAIVAVGLALFGWLRPVPREVLRVGVVFEEDEAIFSTQNRQFALAPDGSRVVYPGRGSSETVLTQLWVRQLDAPSSRPLPGTEGGVAPFFSPDGENVAFVAQRQLRVVPVTGGAVQTLITDSVTAWGGAWSADGWLYVTIGRRLNRVRSTGGTVELVSVPDTSRGESFHEYPDVHPNGDHVLMQLWIRSVTETEIGILSLKTREVRSLGKAVTGQFLPNGHIAYVTHNGDLLVAPYDEGAMAFGAPGSVLERDVRIDNQAGVALFDVSETGHLMYALGREQEADRVVWVDRTGNVTSMDQEWGGPFRTPALSPDGSRVAVVVVNAGGAALWTKQVNGGLPMQLTFGRGPFRSPTWSPDGTKIAFVSLGTIWQRNADGSGQATQVGVPAGTLGSGSVIWSPTGQLVYEAERGGGRMNIRAWRPDGDSTERVVIEGNNDSWSPTISPDGRWIAYVSDEFGREEVVLTRFPDAGEDKWRVSLDGGMEPAWAHSGRELFFRTRAGQLVSRSVDLGDVVTLGSVQPLFDASEFQANPFQRQYDVAPDDQRFVMIRPGASTSTLMMVANWLEELEALGR